MGLPPSTDGRTARELGYGRNNAFQLNTIGGATRRGEEVNTPVRRVSNTVKKKNLPSLTKAAEEDYTSLGVKMQAKGMTPATTLGSFKIDMNSRSTVSKVRLDARD